MKLAAVGERSRNSPGKPTQRSSIPEDTHDQITRHKLGETTAGEFQVPVFFSRGEHAADHRCSFPALWFLTHLEVRAKSERMADTPDLIGTKP